MDAIAAQHVENPRMAGFVPSFQAGTGTFGFADLLDMVNPLQHIPLVNLAYRKITHDAIKPVSTIIGGGIFGGPAGVAGSLVNVVIEEETGKDVLGNVMALTEDKSGRNDLERESAAYDDLPAALLSFAQTPVRTENQYVGFAEGRTAGTIAVYA